jgi:hypothetical protein
MRTIATPPRRACQECQGCQRCLDGRMVLQHCESRWYNAAIMGRHTYIEYARANVSVVSPAGTDYLFETYKHLLAEIFERAVQDNLGNEFRVEDVQASEESTFLVVSRMRFILRSRWLKLNWCGLADQIMSETRKLSWGSSGLKPSSIHIRDANRRGRGLGPIGRDLYHTMPAGLISRSGKPRPGKGTKELVLKHKFDDRYCWGV